MRWWSQVLLKRVRPSARFRSTDEKYSRARSPHSSLPERVVGYGGTHDLDQVLIAPAVEVAKETVATITPGRRGRRLWAAS